MRKIHIHNSQSYPHQKRWIFKGKSTYSQSYPLYPHKKIELLTQAQSESFNPNQIIELFYDNMTQTKMLSNRVEIIEDKINAVQNAVEKLISYVEQ